jgi:hypothetical protein
MSEPYTMFFSHKVNDKVVTNDLIKLLTQHTKNIDFFVSENIEKGTPWRPAIAKNLDASSFLVLVFTDPDEDWGWCLYETGFFDGLRHLSSSKQRRICCLHHDSAAPPSPIADLQTIRANENDVKQWLRELFTHTQQEGVRFESLQELTKQICMLFAIEQKPVYSQQSIRITTDGSSLTSPDDLPGNTKIKGDERLLLELFNIYKEKTDWETIKAQFDNTNPSGKNVILWYHAA